jgi:hypothetical protein
MMLRTFLWISAIIVMAGCSAQNITNPSQEFPCNPTNWVTLKVQLEREKGLWKTQNILNYKVVNNFIYATSISRLGEYTVKNRKTISIINVSTGENVDLNTTTWGMNIDEEFDSLSTFLSYRTAQDSIDECFSITYDAKYHFPSESIDFSRKPQTFDNSSTHRFSNFRPLD